MFYRWCRWYVLLQAAKYLGSLHEWNDELKASRPEENLFGLRAYNFGHELNIEPIYIDT